MECSEELQVYKKSFADFSERNIFISKDKSLNRKMTIWVRTMKIKVGI